MSTSLLALERPATVELTLIAGVRPAAASDQDTQDMVLDLEWRAGQFLPKVWGWAIDLQKCDHEGRIVSVDGDKLTIEMQLNRDAFGLRNNPQPLGHAEYELILQRDGDQFSGTFTGRIRRDGTGESVTAVQGRVVGRVIASWTEPSAGYVRLAAQEHPRLIFRKQDLPLLRQRLATPVGQVILARFLKQLPIQHAANSKNQAFYPAGYGLAYQLTGEQAHAAQARELLEDMLQLGGSQDIHYGPIAQAMAVTLDLCYDAWEPEFRQRVIDNLLRRLHNLETLTDMGGASLNPWHNHEAIRACGSALAAICLLGEKTSDGQPIAGLDRIIQVNARSIRRFFQTNSNTGWGMEGAFYKRMTWNSGPGHVVQAYRVALGGEMMAGLPGQWSMLGEWMWQAPAARIATAHDLGDQQSAGLWPLGWVTVPDAMKAGARWLYDHAFGLEGDRTFGILWAYHAGYLLMNYPFDVPAKPPAQSLPWVAPDPTGGHWIFRKPWQGANDSLLVLNPHSDHPGGTHWIVGNSWDMQLFALGKLWIGDRLMGEKVQGPGAALPTTAVRRAYTDLLSARLIRWQASDNGSATLSWDLSPVYMQQAPKDGAAAGQKLVRMSRIGSFVDYGIRVSRQMGIDLSSASGAPVVLAILDQSQGAREFTWNLRLAEEMGGGKVAGNTVVVGDPAGANLKCTFLGPNPPVLTGAIRASGRDEYLAIITVQNGPAPVVTGEGDGLPTSIRIGAQTLRRTATGFLWEK